MNIVHLSILGGLVSIAIPLLLHMLGRKQPQLIDFPALRFVKQTQLEQSRSWKLRHFLLLLLRVLLLAVLVFALARPRVHSATMGNVIGIAGLILLAVLASLAAAIAYASRRPMAVWIVAALIALMLWIGSGLWAYRSIARGPALPTSDTMMPVAVAMIVDTSPAMSYVADNQTRLQVAQEMAGWLLDRLPVDSHVGVLAGVPIGSLAQSPQAAGLQISRLDKTSERVDLPSRLRAALDLVLADELERKEIYILTDMSASAWSSAQAELANRIEQVKDQVLIQIIDVSANLPVNWQLGDLKVDYNTIPAGGDIAIRVPVTQSTHGAQAVNSVTVELWKEAIDPKLPVIQQGKLQLPASSVVARQVINFQNDGTVQAELVAKGLSEGIHHFKVRLDKNDPLIIDNQRFLSITAKSLQPTLVVSNNGEAALQISLVLDPYQNESPQSLVTRINYSQLPQAALTRYAVVVLFDPADLPPNVVQSLKEHVMGGGGLLLVMGRALESVAADAMQSAPLVQLLPGEQPSLLRRPPSDRSAFWQATAPTYPVYQDLERSPTEIAWQLMPIFTSWNFAKLNQQAQVLAVLNSSEAPLLLAHSLGSGQILTLTTPIPEFEQTRSPVWNELWISAELFHWSFGLLSGCLRTLSGADQSPLTFAAGSSVSLPNDPAHWPKNWEMYTPTAQRIALESATRAVVTGPVSDVGTYHLRGVMGAAVARGFSVNIAAVDTTLERTDVDSLNVLLGEGNFRVARQKSEVETSVGNARFGQELYPLLMLFVAGIFLAEQIMSNRFYKIQLRVGKAARA